MCISHVLGSLRVYLYSYRLKTSEKLMVAKEKGQEKAEGTSDHVIYKIEVPANRYTVSSCLMYNNTLPRSVPTFTKV